MILEKFITEKEREVDGETIRTYQYNYPSEVNIDIEVGTNDKDEKRHYDIPTSYFRMKDVGNTNFIHVRPITNDDRDYYDTEPWWQEPIKYKEFDGAGIKFVVRGNWELRQMIEAFEFGLYVLKKQSSYEGYE